MATSELESFVRKFTLLCRSGITANLQAKTNAGKVWVSLHAELGPVQHSHHRHHGPARERRRARRATARAEQVAAQAAEQVAAQAAELAMAAEQAAALSSPNPDAAAQASVSIPASPNAAEQVALLPPPTPAAQVGHEGHAGHRSVLVPVAALLHVPPLPGESIPQLDGSTMPTPSNLPSKWSCKCCRYEKFFNTEDELQQHHNGPDDRGDPHFLSYEECNICYPWHVWS